MFIASSTDTHADHLRRAATAGIPVLCEKPIDLDFARAAAVVRYAKTEAFSRWSTSTGVSTATTPNSDGWWHRATSARCELIQMTSRGPSLPPLDVHRRLRRPDARPDRALLRPRQVDRRRGPEEVFATGSTLTEPRLGEYGDVDISAVTLRFPSGALVQIDSARQIGYGYDERIEVLGSTGMVEARRHRTGAVSRYTGRRVVDDGLHDGWFERVARKLPRPLGSLRRRPGGRRPRSAPTCRGAEGQAIAEAATRSLATAQMEPMRVCLTSLRRRGPAPVPRHRCACPRQAPFR